MSLPAGWEGLSPEAKRELLAELLREKVSVAPTPGNEVEEPIRAEAGDGPRKLSASQRRLWFFDRMEPGSAAYNIGLGLGLSGSLDVSALERSLGFLVARHETLRCRFQPGDGDPVAHILPPLPIALPVSDLAARPLADAEAEAARILEADSQIPFDLETGRLMRARLVRLAADRHELGLTIHHIVTDGWSLGVLIAELLKAYEAFALGREPDLPELAFQYGDYAAWEARWLEGEAAKQQADYWRKRLAGPLSVVDLPVDFPRPKVQTFRGGKQLIRLTPEQNQAIADLSRAHGATPFMTILAAFALVLHRLSGFHDIPIGVPFAGRNREGTDRLLGVFINTVVVRHDFEGDPTFEEHLRRTRTLALEAYRNAELPFDRVVDAVRPRRDPGRTPLFQVLVNSPSLGRKSRFEVEGLTVELRGDAMVASKFDLTLYIGIDDQGMGLALSYNADLFREARMEELLAQTGQVLDQITAHPGRRLSEISLLTPRAQAVLPNPLEVLDPSPGPAVLHGLTEAAKKQPSKTAVIAPHSVLDYASLDRLSRGLARRLRTAGISRGDVVAIRASRSAELVWGLCGVLRAGAGFVILDAAYPSARIAASIEAAAPRAWLESPGLPEVGPEVQSLLDRPGWLLRGKLESSLAEAPGQGEDPADPGPDDLAYVAFTSGTTGGIKGIAGDHRALAHFLNWHVRTFGLGADDRFSMISGLSHDPLLRDVFTPLRLGASLHIPEQDDILAPGRLREWMAREGITIAHLTPGIARLLADESAGGELPLLRYAFLGGDVLTRDEVRGLRRVAPSAQIVNFYGATETPQAMGFYLVPEETESEPLPASMPVGRGIDDVQVLVLATGGRLAGVGEVGEIAVRTPHLARGYVGDDELTRQRFVTSPFSGQSEDRVYRTGDLGRYRPDGTVEFAGRADTQVKIRGFRVELGEVEAVLREHALVSGVATALVDSGSGEKHLTSYVVPASGSTVQGAELRDLLRSHLKTRLPSHMVPSTFVFLEALPLTPNGKVDRKALALLEEGMLEANPGGPHQAPRTATEEILAGIWSEVLRVERVGTDDDFFAIGGHSLLATQVVSRVRKTLGVELTIRELFDAPTVAALAARVDVLRSRAGSVPEAPPLLAEPGSGPAELSYSQQRLWFIEQLEPGGSANVIAGALAMRGRLDPSALERALETIVARHESLRTTFVSVDGSPTQHVSPPGSLPLPLVDLGHEADPEKRVDEKVQEEVQRGFDLARGPLFRASLYRLGPESHVLLLCMHHIVSDGWSIGVITRELSALYEGALRGDLAVVPALPVQYRDFARWQRRWIQGEVLAAQVEHWRGRLAGAPQVLELPTDRPRPAVESHRGARFGFTLPRELKESLGALSRREGVTLFATLLAGFSALLARYTGQEDLLVGSPVANRNRTEVEGLIGFFVNTLILRTRLDGDPTVRELLARVREECLQAFTRQDLPFEKLVEDLRPERDASRNPLFQVMLVLQNAPLERLRLGDLELVPMAVDRGAAQLDLTLFVFEATDGLRATFEYATDLFDEGTIARMAGHLRRLLEGMVASPEARLSSLPLLTQEEGEAIASWNANQRAYPRACVHELILEAARKDPARVIAECGNARMSYGELDERSGRLAEHLRGQGVGPDVLVGIFMERSLDMLVGLMAILRAGGAYVPLDPAYPKERLAYMIESSAARVVVTESALLGSLPTQGLIAVCADRDLGEPGSGGAALPQQPDDLAYVIFTSGSTGKPKGVAISHGALLNLLVSMAREPGLTAQDVLLSVTTLSFDIAGLELYLPLLTGARLVLLGRDEAGDGRVLAGRLATSGATVMQATPATWRLLLEAGWSGTPGLKVLCGGEALPRDLANALSSRAAQVWNVYGPTETTIWSSAWRVVGGDGAVPIGWPIANTTLHVLDRHSNPLPVGVAGELFIGGDGVARGYWGRPDLTAERFLPDPFAERPGARMYRTGDLARRLSDGSIECLGRLDHQVKVRGFRIELGEIEASLRRYPGVEGAVVLAQDMASGDRRLVAYLSHGSNEQPNVTTLRTHLKESLPTYMIPSSFVFLDRLPLTPNGKLDRKALATLESGMSSSAKAHVEPRNPTEAFIAELWREALGVERVSVRDNFFDIGGHSLLAMRILAAIEKKTGHSLHPRSIIFQTLEQIAASCDASPEGRRPEAPAAEPRRVTGRVLSALRRLVPGSRPSPDDA